MNLIQNSRLIMQTRISTVAQKLTKKVKALSDFSNEIKLAAIKDKSGGMSLSEVAKKYGVGSRMTVQRWCRNHQEGKPLQETVGRPPMLSETLDKSVPSGGIGDSAILRYGSNILKAGS